MFYANAQVFRTWGSRMIAILALSCCILLKPVIGADDKCASPRSVLITLLEALAAGDDRAAERCCTDKGWRQIEGERRFQLETRTNEDWKRHYRRLLPLKDKDTEWRLF